MFRRDKLKIISIYIFLRGEIRRFNEVTNYLDFLGDSLFHNVNVENSSLCAPHRAVVMNVSIKYSGRYRLFELKCISEFRHIFDIFDISFLIFDTPFFGEIYAIRFSASWPPYLKSVLFAFSWECWKYFFIDVCVDFRHFSTPFQIFSILHTFGHMTDF